MPGHRGVGALFFRKPEHPRRQSACPWANDCHSKQIERGPDPFARAPRDYQQQLLLECWDFDALGARLRRLLGLLRDNRRVIDADGMDAIDALERQTHQAVVAVAVRCRDQLRSLFREDLTPEDDERVHERLRRASAYFSEQLQQGLRPWLDVFSFGTDNKALRKSLRQVVEELRRQLTVKTAGLESWREGFATAAHLGALAKARIEAESDPDPTGPGPDPRPDDTKDPGLLGVHPIPVASGLGHHYPQEPGPDLRAGHRRCRD